MTRLDALFVPNNILNCHIPDKIEIQTAINCKTNKTNDLSIFLYP